MPSYDLDWTDQQTLTFSQEGWHFAIQWEALQPQRIRITKPVVYIQAKSSTQAEFEAKIFADSFPNPVYLKAMLDIVVHQKAVELDELLPNLEKLRERRRNPARTLYL